jgi:hypothetical protein
MSAALSSALAQQDLIEAFFAKLGAFLLSSKSYRAVVPSIFRFLRISLFSLGFAFRKPSQCIVHGIETLLRSTQPSTPIPALE